MSLPISKRENDQIGTLQWKRSIIGCRTLFNEKNPNQARPTFVGQGVLA